MERGPQALEQATGRHHVIGALWRAADSAAERIADDFSRWSRAARCYKGDADYRGESTEFVPNGRVVRAREHVDYRAMLVQTTSVR